MRAVTGLFWLGLYLAVAVVPLVFALLGPAPRGRDFWTDFSVGLGFVGLAMLGLQFAVVARSRAVAAPYGIDVVIQFHRQISWVATAFVLAHPAILVATDPATAALLNPVGAPWRARAGVLAVVALLALIALTVWKKRLGLRYEWWRLTHGVLATVVVVAALAHIYLVGHYVDTLWKQGLWAATSLAFVGLLVWTRVVRPFRVLRRPWVVDDVVPEGNDVTTVRLRPDGHDGLRFRAGQFAWLTLGGTPYQLEEHPYSFSSSADSPDGSVAFTVKAVGDGSGEVARTEVGARAYVDGPYGVFTTERHEGPHVVLVAGGIGITPVMSILRTLADRGDRRPVLLVYANPSADEVIFRDELQELQQRLDLTVVHVLDDPPEGWTGETGLVDADLLRRHLPPHTSRGHVFVCGPDPMMDAVHEALVGPLGVPSERVVMERFAFVD
ncbi:ferredoxin reductase family protein [Trujillonella humicola]|uniref:ferredoxin reductase family protein n=1 Tax=Trujillonella humicola TaxID=3383699 RepID=UPI003905D0E5